MRTARVLALIVFAVIGGLIFTHAGSPSPARATFPGDNGRIVVVADDGSGNDLWTMNPDRRRAQHPGLPDNRRDHQR